MFGQRFKKSQIHPLEAPSSDYSVIAAESEFDSITKELEVKVEQPDATSISLYEAMKNGDVRSFLQKLLK